MAVVRFLAGTGFADKTLNFQPGTFYLDTETGEMWFDDPKGVSKNHAKVIDLDTLVYEITEYVEFPSEGGGSTPVTPPGGGGTTPDNPNASGTSAVLGIGILGTMKLGQSQ